MKFSLRNIFSSNNKNEDEQSDLENYTEEIINSIEEKPFAISDYNVMYAGMKELAGYFYFRTIIIGKFKVKTFKGAELKINYGNKDMRLKSDMNEFESEHTNVPNRNVTSIDFEIDEKQIEILNTSKIEALQVTTKKHDIIFNTIKD